MLSKKNRTLVYLLMFILIFSLSAIIFVFFIDTNHELDDTITKQEKVMGQLTEELLDESSLVQYRENLDNAFEAAQVKYYQPDEMDLYTFGITINELFSTLEIHIKKYQTVREKEADLLEFSISGDIVSCLEFMKITKDSEKYWTVDFMTMKMNRHNDEVDMVIRIGYETISANDS